MEPVKIRNGKWGIAEEDGNRWTVGRTGGVAYGLTPDDAIEAAYMDGGEPRETFPTRREARAYCDDDAYYSLRAHLENTEDQEAGLRLICEAISFLGVDDPRAKKLVNLGDWADYYPEADVIDGKFTGEFINADNEDYIVIGVDYAVHIDNIPAGEQIAALNGDYTG